MCEETCNTQLLLLEELKKAGEQIKELREIIKLAALMRDAQKRYFKDRTTQALNESKDYERRVDAAIAAQDNRQQGGLFG